MPGNEILRDHRPFPFLLMQSLPLTVRPAQVRTQLTAGTAVTELAWVVAGRAQADISLWLLSGHG